MTWTARLEILTPVYGGGSEPGQPDTDTPFRVSGIRGQLRFWWRATQGATFVPLGDKPSYARLRAAEAALWGLSTVAREERRPDKLTAAVVSAVTVRIEACNGQVIRRTIGGDRVPLNSGHGYVYFPGREIRGQKPAGTYWWGPSATLRIDMDPRQLEANLSHLPAFDRDEDRRQFLEDAPRQVAAAMWAWGCFGGIGARTRRGAGAIALGHVTGPDDSLIARQCGTVQELGTWLREAAARFVRGDGACVPDFPLLKGANVAYAELVPGPRQVRGRDAPVSLDEPEQVISAVGDIMRNFRQGVPFARNPGSADPRRPGRSRWPEPDAIRRLLGQWSPQHRPEKPTFFPRAALGLPIVVKFSSSETSRGDPQGQVTIRPAGEIERLASPLILRPLRLARGYAVVCVLLNTVLEPPGGLVLEHAGGAVAIRPAAWPVAGASHESVGEVPPLRGVPQAPAALMLQVAARNGGRFQA